MLMLELESRLMPGDEVATKFELEIVLESEFEESKMVWPLVRSVALELEMLLLELAVK